MAGQKQVFLQRIVISILFSVDLCNGSDARVPERPERKHYDTTRSIRGTEKFKAIPWPFENPDGEEDLEMRHVLFEGICSMFVDCNLHLYPLAHLCTVAKDRSCSFDFDRTLGISGRTFLTMAVYHNKRALVEALYHWGVSFNKKDLNGRTPLQEAYDREKKYPGKFQEMIALLKKCGAQR